MSSHHIVREKQEPALLIIDLFGFDEEYLGQLLEWSPMIMVADSMIEKVASLGIKIDMVLTKQNKINLIKQEHIKLLKYEDAVLDTAMKHLVSEGFPAVNIITNHFKAKEYLFYVDLIDVVVFDKDKKIYPIKSGFNKWMPKGELIGVLHEEFVKGISTVGLKDLDQGNYETEKDGFFGFTFDPPYIFITEQL